MAGVIERETVTESEILADLISSGCGDLAPELAETVLRWKFSDRALQRINDLAARNSEGLLNESEREELDKYVRVGTFVNVLQAKARLSLASAG